MKNFGPIIAPRKGLTSIPQLEYSKFSGTINFSHNPIKLMDGLPQLNGFQTLILDDTKLESFAGAKTQPGLESFSCVNTPLGNSQYLSLMSLIVLGDQLKFVNNVKVSQKALNQAKQFKEDLYSYLTQGWVLTNTSPLRIANVQTKQRKTIQKQQKDEKEEICIYLTEETENQDDEEKQKNEEKKLRQLRYRFNQLVHPKRTAAETTKPAPKEKTQKPKQSPQKSPQKQTETQEQEEKPAQKKVKTTSISYRQTTRQSPIRAKLQAKKVKSPFQEEQEKKRQEEKERIEKQGKRENNQ